MAKTYVATKAQLDGETTSRAAADTSEATARAAADVALDVRLDVLEARPQVVTQQTQPDPETLPAGSLWIETDGATPPNIVALHVVVDG